MYNSYSTALRRSKPELATAVVTLFVGAVFGATQPPLRTPTAGNSGLSVQYFVIHNARVLFGLWLGAPFFGVPSFIGLFLNGTLIGNAVLATGERNLLLFLPHAVIEVPGIVVAGAVGFKPLFAFGRYLTEHQSTTFRPNDLRDMLRLAILSLACIVIAGAIEGVITPVVA